ncbi:hypothetical protein [Deinococcus peraridilitoris]|uniref:hypothetical protein n=1 Tax=Deinococcus peraridilitoris TaxID=432329 RepID=UPI001FE026F0|nr:hypothetical protein [Deinococcus peraridilitoris]
MTMDRTHWEYGEAELNVLVLGVVLEGFTLPLVWMALPHGGVLDRTAPSGPVRSSDTGARERLVARLLKVLPAMRWRVLVVDREFVGRTWFSFLRRRGIKRCLRVRGNPSRQRVRASCARRTCGSPSTPGARIVVPRAASARSS